MIKPNRMKTQRWLAVLATLLLLSVSGGMPARASAAEGPTASVRELRERAMRNFSQGEFDAAIPDFEELTKALGESKDSNVRMGLDTIYYDLSLSYFFTANFSSAEQAFRNYIKKYPNGANTANAYVYVADCLRLSGSNKKAIAAYEDALKRYSYPSDLLTDIYSSIAQCDLAEDNWDAARRPLFHAFRTAPDALRRGRSATLLATAYLKTLSMEKIYLMVPFLLQRDSLASRSIAFNMAALEAGDKLFQDEHYREAFWLHRLVFPHDMVQARTEAFRDYLQKCVDMEKKSLTDPRKLMRMQEWIGETEAELKALEGMENYDTELEYRIARGYMEAQRHREARELFLHLSESGGKEKAEEALYLAFVCSSRLPPWGRAYEIGKQYMAKYPAGQWYDELTLLMGQMYAKESNWAEVIRHLDAVLLARPNHQSAVDCLFLLGYANFMEEHFDMAVARMNELVTRFPQSELVSGAIYWTAMARMFGGSYEEACAAFDNLLAHHPDVMYTEDALFRRAICNYALGQFDKADTRLAGFIKEYSKSKLVPEAWMTRGDIAGAQGRTTDSVLAYQHATEFPDDLLNIEHYNHCAFQAGQILFDAKRFPEARSHYLRYIERNRAESNIPLAVYWIGRTFIETGEPLGAARYYKDAVLKYGVDRKQIGVDMILDEWVATTHKLPADKARLAWNDFQQSLRDARDKGDKVGTLRLTRVLMFHPDIKPNERETILVSLLHAGNITNASPAVLETMLDGAISHGLTNLAVAVADDIVKEFTETDYALNARLFLAKHDIDMVHATADQDQARGWRADAIRHLDVIRNVFASSEEAAQALLMLGVLYREDGKNPEAEKCYEDVLAVRAWGKYWPEALYNRGLCTEARKEYGKATAYYERMYVMYSKFRPWTAKAYVRRAECLHRIYEDNKAIETLKEMIGFEDLAQYPEYEQAKQMLAKLEARQ